MRFLFIFLALTASVSGGAAENPVKTPLSGASILQMLLSLALVVALIFVSMWLLKRVNTMGLGSNSALRVVASLPLGARDRLLLVAVGKQQILLGVSPGRIQTLHVLPEPIEIESQQPVGAAFQNKLLEALQGKRTKGVGDE